MTIKQIAEVSGCNRKTVERKINELYPAKMQKGKATRLNQKEAIAVMSELRKKGFVQPSQNVEVPSQNVEVRNSIMIETLNNIVKQNQEFMLAMFEKLNNQPKQIEAVKEDYFTIKAYCIRKGIQVTRSYASALGKQASKLSREQNFEIRLEDDSQFGYVNSYSIDILDQLVKY